MTEIKSLRAYLDDKRGVIADQLVGYPPTVVIPSETGIRIFASEIEKVHSTIVIAGAGSDVSALSQYFRDQILKLRQQWADNVPRAEVDGKILFSAFRANVSPNEHLLYADILLVELKPEFGSDIIHHFDFSGRLEKLVPVVPHWVSYRTLDLDEKNDKREIEKRLYEEMKKYGLKKDDLELELAETVESLSRNYPGKSCFLNRAKLKEKNFYHVFES
jgi:hypothetical protein